MWCKTDQRDLRNRAGRPRDQLMVILTFCSEDNLQLMTDDFIWSEKYPLIKTQYRSTCHELKTIRLQFILSVGTIILNTCNMLLSLNRRSSRQTGTGVRQMLRPIISPKGQRQHVESFKTRQRAKNSREKPGWRHAPGTKAWQTHTDYWTGNKAQVELIRGGAHRQDRNKDRKCEGRHGTQKTLQNKRRLGQNKHSFR